MYCKFNSLAHKTARQFKKNVQPFAQRETLGI